MNGLEPSPEEMRDLIGRASEVVIDYLSRMCDSAGQGERGGSSLLCDQMPEDGTDVGELLRHLREVVLLDSVNTAGPAYQGYIPGGGLFSSAIAQFIAASTNRYVGVPGLAPAAVRIENAVIGWFRKLAGYGPAARGILTSGGSLANFSAIVAARCARLPENFLRGTLYVSDQTHHSIQKAAMLAGFPTRNVRVIPSDERFRMREDALLRCISNDREAGFQPFLIVGTAGTTNTGAVDALAELADIAVREGMWLHIDAAYGGFFLLTERGRHILAGIEHSDSITLDPHKGLFLPYGTGCLLVRDGEMLRQAHQWNASYLQDLPEGEQCGSEMNFADYSPELSRPFRGLGVWLPIMLVGTAAFRRSLDEKLDLACWASTELKQLPGIEIISEPELSVVAFRLKRDQGDLNNLNRRLLDRINGTGRTFLTSTTIAGQVVLRIAILCFRTHEEHVRRTLLAIQECAAEVSAKVGEGRQRS